MLDKINEREEVTERLLMLKEEKESIYKNIILNKSKNNSLIQSNSRAFRTNNINFNSISSNSIFSIPKNISKYNNNYNYYNPLINRSSSVFFSY